MNNWIHIIALEIQTDISKVSARNLKLLLTMIVEVNVLILFVQLTWEFLNRFWNKKKDIKYKFLLHNGQRKL